MNPNQAQNSADGWAAGGVDLAALHVGLCGLQGFTDVSPDALEPMRTKGLNHAHIRVSGADAVVRIPRLSAYGFTPADNLAYQAACFRRATPSGTVPRLLGEILPSDGIPWGALVVEDIKGESPRLPDHMRAIADALAALHSLPVPDADARSPLLSHTDPVRATVEVIATQARFLDRAQIDPDAHRQIDEELAWARSFAAEADLPSHPVTLAGTDTHPGNFLVAPDGRAVFVDLEKTVYGSPAIDLAHACVYTSTMWDADIATALTQHEVSAFYDRYIDAVPPSFADSMRPWCEPMRRLTWLRTTTWCAKLRVQSNTGESWAPGQYDPAYVEYVRARVADYFDPATIEHVRAGFNRK